MLPAVATCLVPGGEVLAMVKPQFELDRGRVGRGVVTVVPVTSNVDRIFPFQALLPATETGLRQDSKAQAEQVRSVAVERIGAVLGRAPADVMVHLDDALRLHLHL